MLGAICFAIKRIKQKKIAKKPPPPIEREYEKKREKNMQELTRAGGEFERHSFIVGVKFLQCFGGRLYPMQQFNRLYFHQFLFQISSKTIYTAIHTKM